VSQVATRSRARSTGVRAEEQAAPKDVPRVQRRGGDDDDQEDQDQGGHRLARGPPQDQPPDDEGAGEQTHDPRDGHREAGADLVPGEAQEELEQGAHARGWGEVGPHLPRDAHRADRSRSPTPWRR